MKLTIIACPFQTSYGQYVESLKRSLEAKIGDPVVWLASNCGCGDPIETSRAFQTQSCRYFEMPNLVDFHSAAAWKRFLRVRARTLLYYVRARKYSQLSNGADLVHFQQILNAYGSDVVFHWLNQPSNAARVITVHELDGRQVECPDKNVTYNKADALIVHCEELREKLIHLGVKPDKIHVVLYGTLLPETDESRPRQGILFYGGHKLMSGKGLDTLFRAMRLLKDRLGPKMPQLKIHGHYGFTTPEKAKEMARHEKVEDRIVWLNQLPADDAVRLYLDSQVCVLPYTGGFAGFPSGLAAAAGLPVIATRTAGIPDYLGDCGIWIDVGNADQLAGRIAEVLGSETLRRETGRRLRQRAEQLLGWDTIGDRTVDVYRQALAAKAAGARAHSPG